MSDVMSVDEVLRRRQEKFRIADEAPEEIPMDPTEVRRIRAEHLATLNAEVERQRADEQAAREAAILASEPVGDAPVVLGTAGIPDEVVIDEALDEDEQDVEAPNFAAMRMTEIADFLTARGEKIAARASKADLIAQAEAYVARARGGA